MHTGSPQKKRRVCSEKNGLYMLCCLYNIFEYYPVLSEISDCIYIYGLYAIKLFRQIVLAVR